MAGLTLEQLKKMGATPKQIAPPEQPKQPSFLERVQSDVTKRQETFAQGAEAQAKGQQTPLETGLQQLGGGAGLVLDVAGEALKSVVDKIPDAIKKPIEDIGTSVLHTPLGQAGIKAISMGTDAYKSWKTGNPRVARDLEAIVNVASLFPVAKVAQIGAKGGEVAIKPILETAGKTLKTSGETILKSERQSFVQNLIRPAQTKSVKEAQVARTTEIGGGINKKSVIAPSNLEATVGKYVSNIPNVNPKNTIQGNFNAIRQANIEEAKKLSSELTKNDFIYPRKELLSRLNIAKETLAKNPVITGDAEKTAEKLVAEFKRRIDATPAKGSNLLQVRKEFDAWIEKQKGGTAFDPVKENAFSIANREIRQTVNSFLDEKAPNIGVKDSLKKQTALYNALDNIKPKAAYEADTAIKRFLQRAETVLGTKNKAVQIIAASVGIGGLGAAATFAPAAATLGIGGYLLYRGGKLVFSPTMRKALGNLLIELGRPNVSKTIGATVTLGSALKLRNEIQKLLDDYND